MRKRVEYENFGVCVCVVPFLCFFGCSIPLACKLITSSFANWQFRKWEYACFISSLGKASDRRPMKSMVKTFFEMNFLMCILEDRFSVSEYVREIINYPLDEQNETRCATNSYATSNVYVHLVR
jgi:hypothetical protein